VITSALTPLAAAVLVVEALQNLTRTEPTLSTRSGVALTCIGRFVGPGNDTIGKSVTAAPGSAISAVEHVFAVTAGNENVVFSLVPEKCWIVTDPAAI
jgi:hypothetical protein